MFHCTVYRTGAKLRQLSSNKWDLLREDVGKFIRRYKDAKWGALRDDEGLYVGRFRRSMRTYPKERPNEYLPDGDLFKQPPP